MARYCVYILLCLYTVSPRCPIPLSPQKPRGGLFLIGKEVDFYEGADAVGFVFVDVNK
jgi:hypothetical protein